MPTQSQQDNVLESTVERAKRVQAYVEDLISTTGEHPECELKASWLRNTPYLKAEFVKDVQSIANSPIPPEHEKYIVIGVDEKTRQFIGCNHTDYDEAALRQVLDSYLDAVPEYEVLYPKKDGQNYVVMRIGHQTRKPFIAKKEISDGNVCHLRVSEIWIKPKGGTGKRRLASRDELLSMIDIDSLVAREVEYQMSLRIPQIRLEERAKISGSGFGAVPALTSTDEEFELFVEQLIGSADDARFSILMEKIREANFEVWYERIENEESIHPDEMQEIKLSKFLPAMRRLALLGMTLMRFDARYEWFERVATLLVEILEISRKLTSIVSYEKEEKDVEELSNHVSYTVPAVESILTSALLIAYEVSKRKNVKYSTAFFPRIVTLRSSYSFEDYRCFYLFFPFYASVNRRLDLLVTERFGNASSIKHLFGSEKAIGRGVLQVMCLLDWFSFLSFEKVGNLKGGETETINYLKTEYPNISKSYAPMYVKESLSNVEPLVDNIWKDLPTGTKNYFLLDPKLAHIVSQLEPRIREEMFVRLILVAESEQAKWMLQQMRMPYFVHWNDEIEEIKRELNDSQ